MNIVLVPDITMEQAISQKIPSVFHKTSTIIIPAYNEEKVIGKNLEEVGTYISDNNLKWSVIVSVDGDDNTGKLVSSYSERFPFISIAKSNERNGKGAAVKRVIDKLNSEYVILMDADGSLAFETIVKNLDLLEDSDCLIFSRYFSRNNIPFLRKFLSRGFNILVRALLDLEVRDTQSGYKVFKTKPFIRAMRMVGPTNTFWDVALLYYLYRDKLKIKEISCEYDHRKESKFHPIGEIFGQGISLIAFRIRHSRFYKYIPKSLVSLYYRKLRWI
jgi:glycosyltransferase involved in cell wall biosynthesis